MAKRLSQMDKAIAKLTEEIALLEFARQRLEQERDAALAAKAKKAGT